MHTLTTVPRHIKLYAAGLAMAALVIALLAVSFSAGPTQAQNADNTYPDPQPCGPNAGTASMEEPHEVTEGHFALFDAYWEWTEHWTDDDNPNEGIMHANDCPPEMVVNRSGGLSRAASGIDLGEAIIHVKDVHQATVVATNAEVTEDGGQLSLEEYPDVRKALGLGEADPVEPGTKVWWLRLDDPDTTDRDETSSLSIGFSAALFDDKYWLTRADYGGHPMRYMLETVRYRNIDPAAAPHFLAYEATDIRRADVNRRKPVWDSIRVHFPGEVVWLDPGEYRALQWIFTEPGTYELSSHLQGFVRQENPDEKGDEGYDPNWKPISGNETETSEVRDYVFQVGDPLDETEPPMFGVYLTVHEDATAGTHVGEPIGVFKLEVPDPKYTLSGDGSDDFRVTSRTHPDAVQIVVAASDGLSKSSYDLVLGVSDGKDHEGNNDDSIDHSIAVQIDVIQLPHAYIIASNHTPAVEESVTLSVNVWDLPDGVTGSDLSYTVWEASSTGGVLGAIFPTRDQDSSGGTATVSKDSAGTYKYTPAATYTLDGVTHTLHGDPVTITWRNP